MLKGFDMDTVCVSIKEKYNKSADKIGFLESTYFTVFDELNDLDKEALFKHFDYLDLKDQDSQLMSQEDPLQQILSALKANEKIPSHLLDPFFIDLYSQLYANSQHL